MNCKLISFCVEVTVKRTVVCLLFTDASDKPESTSDNILSDSGRNMAVAYICKVIINGF